MKNSFKMTCFGLSLLTLPAAMQAQEAGKDVPPNHWAYSAVQDLAKKGLIKGYPPDGNFLGNRTLSRYEMATIIERSLGRMDEMVGQKPPAAADRASQADLDALKASVGEIRSLVEDFKKELLVIGTDLSKAKDDIDALKAQMGALSGKVNGFDDRITANEKGIKDTSTAVDQALENLNELRTYTNAQLAKKVGLNNGIEKLTIGGLLQGWYGASLSGSSLNGNPTGNFSGAPVGRSFGGGVGDTFRLRRGEINLTGTIAKSADFRIMLDPAKTGTGAASPLQDLWVGYNFAPHFRFEIGQQKTGLSEEGTRSSSQLLTIERSIMNGLPTTAGRVGDIRDTGAVLRYNHPLGYAMVGVWNDNGVTQNAVDNDRFKFADAHAYFTGIRHLTAGIWGGTNIGDYRPRNKRDRAGATLKWESGPHTFEAEGAYTLDYAGGSPLANRTIGLGGYALYAHSLSKRVQLVARYDEWDPAVHGGVTSGLATNLTIGARHHNLREYTFGVNYFLRGHNSKIQLNYIDVDTQSKGYAFFGARRQILLSNFQTAF